VLGGPGLADWKFEGILPALGDRAADFITRQAKTAQPFLLYLPLTTPHTPFAVNADWRGRSGLGDYADLVMETDALVGRVLAALDASGAADNTLVLFTSDNGCASFAWTDMKAQGHPSSGPLRGYKGTVYEGGHRVPFIVRWPSVVAPGCVSSQLVHQADVMATVAEILGTRLPDNAGEDSVSLLALLRGQEQAVRTHAVSCATSGLPSLRRGSWKFFVDEADRPQLYQLADDIGETRNLAADQPELVAEMRATLEKLIRDGRSTPGARQQNDVEVVRHPVVGAPAAPKAKVKGKAKKTA
jgi:arylsulfatase A-like enzyme